MIDYSVKYLRMCAECYCLSGYQAPDDGREDSFAVGFEPQILAAVSQHVALFPPLQPDSSYPPQFHKASPSAQPCDHITTATLDSTLNDLSPESTVPVTNNLRAHSGDVTPKLNTEGAIFGKCVKRASNKRHCGTTRCTLNPVDFVPQHSAHTTLHPAQLPFSYETLVSLSTFCFPGTSVSRFSVVLW